MKKCIKSNFGHILNKYTLRKNINKKTFFSSKLKNHCSIFYFILLATISLWYSYSVFNLLIRLFKYYYVRKTEHEVQRHRTWLANFHSSRWSKSFEVIM